MHYAVQFTVLKEGLQGIAHLERLQHAQIEDLVDEVITPQQAPVDHLSECHIRVEQEVLDQDIVVVICIQVLIIQVLLAHHIRFQQVLQGHHTVCDEVGIIHQSGIYELQECHHTGVPEIRPVSQPGLDEVVLRHQSGIQEPFQIDLILIAQTGGDKGILSDDIRFQKQGERNIYRDEMGLCQDALFCKVLQADQLQGHQIRQVYIIRATCLHQIVVVQLVR